MELQFMRDDWIEHPSGRRSLVFEEIIHFFEGIEELEGHVSLTVRLPLRRKWKSSNNGFGAGDTVAFTDV